MSNATIEFNPNSAPEFITVDPHPSQIRSKSKPRKHEPLSQRGAMDLAQQLQAYWQAQGSKAARFWAVPIEERFEKVGTYRLYRVDCNLLNGLPPDWPLPAGKE